MMKIQYDATVDAMYICLSDKPFHKMKNINKDVNLDFDEQGNMIGIELLYVSRYADNVQQIIYDYSPKQDRPAQPATTPDQNEILVVEPATSETSA